MPDCYMHSNNLQCPTKDDNDLLSIYDFRKMTLEVFHYSIKDVDRIIVSKV
jgi:hypothetical protein